MRKKIWEKKHGELPWHRHKFSCCPTHDLLEGNFEESGLWTWHVQLTQHLHPSQDQEIYPSKKWMESGTVSYQKCCTTMIHSALEVRDRNQIILAIAIQVAWLCLPPGVKPAFTCNLLEKKIMETWWVSIWCFDLKHFCFLPIHQTNIVQLQECLQCEGMFALQSTLHLVCNRYKIAEDLSVQPITIPGVSRTHWYHLVWKSAIHALKDIPNYGWQHRGVGRLGGGGGVCSTETIIILINRIVVNTIECLSTPHPHKSLTAASCQEVIE